jgi:hypothetical protein
MGRASVDITGAGPHTIITPAANQSILIRRVLLTFSHDAAKALRVWFWAGPNIEAGPFYVSDGGEVRYLDTQSSRTYIGGEGVPLRITMDAGLSCAGLIDYELGSF